MACRHDFSIVSYLIELGNVDFTAKSMVSSNFNRGILLNTNLNALHFACIDDQPEIVRILLKVNKVDINAQITVTFITQDNPVLFSSYPVFPYIFRVFSYFYGMVLF